jgi:outer membrane protein assembly factor BamE (lipoprotein component of BamABCDE complex)
MTLTCGCSIGRIYKGSEIRHDPSEKITIGSTTKGEILEIFGPPLRIQKQFEYTREQQKMDGLVILFDKDGVVKNFGFQRGTKELTIY